MSRQFSTRRSDRFGLVGWIDRDIRSGQFHDRWGNAMPRNLEQQFQAELTQRQQQAKQTKREQARSQWHQWRLILGYLTGTTVIVLLATNGLFNQTTPRSPTGNGPGILQSDPTLTPAPLPTTGMLTQSWSQALTGENSGGIKIYARPPETVDQSKLGENCPTTSVEYKTHYLIKVVDWETGKVVQTLFVRSGEKAEVKLPIGQYKLRFAAGETWYGDQKVFGRSTRYGEFTEKSDLRPMKFDISQPGGFWEMGFYSCLTGNMQNKTIRPEDF